MPTSISGVENRIAQARERHQELHRTTRQDVADWLTLTNGYSAAIEAFNEASEALDAKANAALALSALAATASAVSVLIALKRR
ncbi:hypothetical protein [Rothia mucilaginosa]|uniref:hypothetical protein n=1 Tax=Rothia mucilaginosa TaxID=43675 RepID=UPI0026EBAF95|nr:hypothetical protein [Rothia mucilaginosa]